MSMPTYLLEKKENYEYIMVEKKNLELSCVQLHWPRSDYARRRQTNALFANARKQVF